MNSKYIYEKSLEDAFNSINSIWSKIVIDKGLNPSLLPGWLKCVCDAFEISDSVKVFIAYKENDIIGIIPYYIVRKNIMGVSKRSVELATNIVTYHQELIALQSPMELIQKFIEHLEMNTGWDIFVIKDLWTEGDTYKILTGPTSTFKSITYPSESSPYLVLTETWKDLVASKQKKFRYKVNRREKNLSDNDDLESAWFNAGDNCDELIECILHIEQKSWKAHENMDITSRPIETMYYKNLVPYLSNNKLLLANVLKYKGSAIAYNLCYQMNGKVGQIKTSFDKNFHELSPGAMIIEEALRHYYSQGFVEFDFLGDIMPHKMAWTKNTRSHETVTLYNHRSKGFLLYLFARLRKFIKKIINFRIKNSISETDNI